MTSKDKFIWRRLRGKELTECRSFERDIDILFYDLLRQESSLKWPGLGRDFPTVLRDQNIN